MGEFSPVQLDALEDALEDLELTGIPLEFEDDVAVSTRLGAYRELLQLSREALPSVEVPPGVLASVLAVARDAAEQPAVAAPPRPDPSAESRVPWWKRLSLWVPALAVAASAALVLVMVQGTLGDAEPAEATLAQADASQDAAKTGVLLERGDELQAAAEPPEDPAEDAFGLGAPQSRGRLRGSAAGERAGDDAEAVLEEQEAKAEPEADAAAEAEAPAFARPSAPPAVPEATDKVIYDKGAPTEPAKERKPKPAESSASGSSGKKQDASTPTPSPKPKSEPSANAPGGAAGGAATSDPSQQLTSADESRRTGHCSHARSVYRGLLEHSDAKIRARALAGLGLCSDADGDDDAAAAYFSRARKADSGIGSFISREQDAAKQRSQQAL